MRAHTKHTLLASALLIAAGLAIWLGALAGTEPPPPSFWDFSIMNTTGVDVTDIKISVTHANAPGYQSLPSAPTLVSSLASLPTGKTVKLGTPGWFGAAVIEVTATCGELSVTCTISADRSDFTGDGSDEYAGFCPESASGGAAFLGIRFLPPSGGQPLRAVLQGLSRWDSVQSTKTDTKVFQ